MLTWARLRQCRGGLLALALLFGAGLASAQSEGAPSGIVAPVAVETPLEYPEGGEGTHTIILELLVNQEGGVDEAKVIAGDPEMGKAAVASALEWKFEPATRDGLPAAARIRFEVVFEPPEEAQEPAVDTTLVDRTIETQPLSSDSPPPAEEEVIVEGFRPEGQRSLSRATVRQLPGAFGDAFRAVETLPGVTPIISGLPYFYIRGAPPGNVGYFLDSIRVPLLYHIAAGPSVIHPAFVERVDLYAGPYPSRYGRFAGGIVAGETAPPAYEHRGELSIRLVDSGGMIETHAFDRRLSLMAAGRYSYTAAVISLVAPDVSVSYWDYQGRVQYTIDNDETLTLFTFGALDKASEEQPSGPDLRIFDLIFHRWDLRYDKRYSDGGQLRVGVLGGTDITGVDVFELRDRLVGGRIEYDRPLADNLALRGGIDIQTDHYTAQFDEEFLEEEEDDEEIDSEAVFPARDDIITGIRGDLVWEPEPGVRVIPGTRFDFYVADGTPLWAISPRIFAEFDVRRHFTIKHGLGVAHQLPSFAVPLPGFQPVGQQGLQRAIQHSAGVEWRMPHDVTAELTLFQNLQLNITDPLGGIRFDDIGEDFDARTQGAGRGVEVLIRRPLTRRLGGYLAYTLSRSTRSFGRQRGPASFDRTHVLSGALGYQLGKGWNAGARATLYTGIPATGLSPARFSNPPRTAPFYRFDWRVEKRWDVGAKGAWWAMVFEVLNTTLKKESIVKDCGGGVCTEEFFGPVTIPSIGAEASF